MTDRPILFSGPMVRALLAGTKTQTRRIVKPQPHCPPIVSVEHPKTKRTWRDGRGEHWAGYGKPSDRLWVRETWRTGVAIDHLSPKKIGERCTDAGYRKVWAPVRFEADHAMNEYEHTLRDFGGAWGNPRVSIHMPRWASRITLDITDVRVQRLQEISEEDAMAEGAEPILVPPDGGSQPHVEGFHVLWESINGIGSWDLNPSVWAITFKRVNL